MSNYRKLENIKKSLYEFIEDKIPELTGYDYIVGDGATNLTFYFSFPEGPEVIELKLPSLSLDFTAGGPYIEYDLGNEAKYEYRFVINIFSRNSRERDYLTGVIDEILNKSIPYNDYNIDGSCMGYLRNYDISCSPLRLETPGEESYYRSLITFKTELIDEYPN
jgi:hypothetical protein